MKRILSIILTLSMLLGITVNADREITVNIDGERIEFDTQPIIDNDCVLVPMRAIFEVLGAEVEWNEQYRFVIARRNRTIIQFTIGSAIASKDTGASGAWKIELGAPVQIINDITYIPVRAISEVFGYTVTWNDRTKTVSVRSPAPTATDEIIETLVGYDIISENDVSKDLYITNLEALRAINQVRNGGLYEADLKSWYYGNTLEPLDYLDDETKSLLLSLTGGKRIIIKKEELLNTDLNSNLTEYQALVYLTRMIGSTYGCTDHSAEPYYTEVSQTYNIALEKGLINTADMSDDFITREDFYSLLTKALYAPFMSGGAGGASEVRYIEKIRARTKRVAEATPTSENM